MNSAQVSVVTPPSFLSYFPSQEGRVSKMDHFFASLACLMSRNLRSAVYASIEDLLRFLETYRGGNDYSGAFHRSLPVRPQPVVLTVVGERPSTNSQLLSTYLVAYMVFNNYSPKWR